MAEVDTSSYPKPVQSNFLDTATKFQGLAQGATNLQRSGIALEQDKLKQLNDQFNIMNAELSTLANSNATKEQARVRLLNLSRTFGFKPQITQQMMGELDAAPDVKSFAENALVRGMATQEKVNNLYGTPSVYSQGQQDYPVNVSPMRGMTPTGLPIQRQIPPTQEVVDSEGRPTLQGPTPAVTPQGTVAGPGQRLPIAPLPSGPIQNPAIKGESSNFGGNVTGATVEPPATFAERFPAPSGPSVGMSPLFEEGKKTYTADQLLASQKMLAAKPAIQALPLMQTPGFLSGPLTDQFTKVVAGLKSTGLIDIDETADPTAIRQEVTKKLAQYVSSSPVGQRSDAAQALKEASSPNPNVQILPALVKLTKDAIALDRVEALMPNVFKDKDYSKYIKHKGTFPQSIDEKALTLDLESPEKSAQIVDDMAKKLKSSNARDKNSAEKFFKTLRMAKDQGFYQ